MEDTSVVEKPAEKKCEETSGEPMEESSSSESVGPDVKNPEPSSLELDGISSLPITSSTQPISPSPIPPSSVTSTVDLHADQSSVSLDVAQSSVIHSNTLEEIDPLTQDGSSHHSPLTRSSDSNPSQTKHSSQEPDSAEKK